MKITLESTDRIVEVLAGEIGERGVQARIWKGATESGIEIECLVTRIAVSHESDVSEFERELVEKRAPEVAFWNAFPMKMVL